MSCRLWCIAAAVAFGSGCANWQTTRIDPTGEHVFVRDSVAPQSPASGAITPQSPAGDPDIAGVSISPADQFAFVGSETYLVASVIGTDGYLQPHRRLEWTISPGTVGQFKNIEKSDCVDHLLGDRHPHKIVSTNYAVGGTLSFYEQLKRGSGPADIVNVTSGQGWVSLTSQIEGDSVVTVAAPEVYGWDKRQKTATIHWLDVNWQFPPQSLSRAGGKHTLTTTMTKRTSPSPSTGWVVRYSIVGGPPAGFSPDGAISVEVATNVTGQASAEIFQKTAASGANQINIEISRPADAPGANGKKVILGHGAVLAAWTTSPLPPQATSPLTIGPISNAPLTIGPTSGNATPSPSGPRPDSLPAADPRAGGAVVNNSPIEIKISEPPPTPVGNEAQFLITIINRSSQPLENLKLYDAFDPGLQFRSNSMKSHLELPLKRIGANESIEVPLVFRVMQPGQLYHTVKVLDAGNKPLAIRKASVMGTGQAAPSGTPGGPAASVSPSAGRYGEMPVGGQAPTTPPGGAGTQPGGPGTQAGGPGTQAGGPGTQAGGPGTQAGGQGTPPAGPSALSIKVTGPSTKRTVRQIAPFVIEITNTSTKTLNNVKVEALLDPVFGRENAIASQGFWHEKGWLCYLERNLPAGQKLILEIQSECLKAAPQATAFVRVTSVEGAQNQGEASCEILPEGGMPENTPPGNTTPGNTPPGISPPGIPSGPAVESKLEITVTCPTNPARVGKLFNCLVTVVNNGAEEEKDVVVEVVVPDGLTISPPGTVGPDAATKAHIEKQIVHFDPIPNLPPNQPQRYRVQVKTKTANKYTFQAGVISQKLLTPTIKDQSVDVTQ